MPKTFYTERDIEDLYNSGVTSLVVTDDVVVTDLGRERAMKLGFELVREFDQPPSAPVRPYITDKPSPSAAPPGKAIPAQKIQPPERKGGKQTESVPDLETRVYEAVQAKLGDSVDPTLLRTIIRRVVKNIRSN